MSGESAAATELPFSARLRSLSVAGLAPHLVALVAFAILFVTPAQLLVRDWWNNPEAGHGLLLAPVAIWLMWKRGLLRDRRPAVWLGLGMLVAAVLLRTAADLAAELYTMRLSMLGAAAGVLVFYHGPRQLLHWWLPATLLVLSVPLPELVINALALPLQFKASAMGASLLEWRSVPAQLTGNVIQIPGHQLFVTEACSGLRSLTAILSLAFLIGGLWLDRVLSRGALLAAAIGVAILVNGVRVFLTGFLVYYVDPRLGDGFMHMTEGWLLFLVSLSVIGLVAGLLALVERRWRRAPDAA